MPGMMDTILNVGLDDGIAAAMFERGEGRRFALDCQRRLLQMYGSVAMNVDEWRFDDIIDRYCDRNGIARRADIDAEGWAELVVRFRVAIRQGGGGDMPANLREQLFAAIGAVFRSWYSARAISYRAMQGMPDDGGAAVTVQRMVFGNRNAASASGVAISRDPVSGSPGICGEYLPMAQGEDVVSGLRTPLPLSRREMKNRHLPDGERALEEFDPASYMALQEHARELERRFHDIQDMEFTIDDGRLFILQTRRGRRSTRAGIRIALDLFDERIIDCREAASRVSSREFVTLVQSVIEPGYQRDVLASGLPVSPGAACGALAFSALDVEEFRRQGREAILVCEETGPADVRGILSAAGVVTSRGGATSHAAQIALANGNPCIVGVREMEIDPLCGRLKIGGRSLRRGEVITIDGASGELMAGEAPLQEPELDEYASRYKALLNECGELR
jgi:pyruvate,orthophosphate dikinase